MSYQVHLRKQLDFHSEGASIERYILKKATSLPFRPTIGLEVQLDGGHFGYTCSRVVWRSASDDYIVWEEKDQINADPHVADCPTIEEALSRYIDMGWEEATKIPERE